MVELALRVLIAAALLNLVYGRALAVQGINLIVAGSSYRSKSTPSSVRCSLIGSPRRTFRILASCGARSELPSARTASDSRSLSEKARCQRSRATSFDSSLPKRPRPKPSEPRPTFASLPSRISRLEGTPRVYGLAWTSRCLRIPSDQDVLLLSLAGVSPVRGPLGLRPVGRRRPLQLRVGAASGRALKDGRAAVSVTARARRIGSCSSTNASIRRQESARALAVPDGVPPSA